MKPATLFKKFRTCRALVGGDICLDRWCHYDPAESDPSRETQIPRLGVVKTCVTPGAGGTVTACALTAPRVDSWLKDPPTVLLLTSDTHRADHLGFMQATEVDTPTLDRLASEQLPAEEEIDVLEQLLEKERLRQGIFPPKDG